MRIEKITSYLLKMPLEKDIGDAAAQYKNAQKVVVEIEAEGLKGIGWTSGFGGETVCNLIERELCPILMGKDPLETESLWWDMFKHTRIIGRKGLTFHAISAVDIALWDLKAKSMEIPLYKLLGGSKKTLPIYGSGGWISNSCNELVKEMVSMVEQGFCSVKMKVGINSGLSPEEDILRVKTVRKALGKNIKLMIDANGSWSVATALKVAHQIEEDDIDWIEEPVLPDDLDGYLELKRRTSIPIAGGENEYTKYGCKELLVKGAIDIMQMDVVKVGGITEWMKVAAMSQAWNIPLAPHHYFTANIHPLCACSNALTLEFLEVHAKFDSTIFDGIPEIVNGYVTPLEKPGIGIELNKLGVKYFCVYKTSTDEK